MPAERGGQDEVRIRPVERGAGPGQFILGLGGGAPADATDRATGVQTAEVRPHRAFDIGHASSTW